MNLEIDFCGQKAKQFKFQTLSSKKESSMTKITPLSDHIVIEPLKEEEKSKGGILLPQSVEKKPEQGKVISVGPGKTSSSGKLIPMEVKVGDKVLFTKYGPNEIKIDNKEYLIATQDDILAIIE
ncbi:MAG: co-chaperone GroES [Candidatus Paceibacterota bacterium]